MTLEITFAILLFLAMLLACLPGIPSVPLMFVVTLGYAAVDRFATLHPKHLVIFGVLAVLSVGVDALSGLIGVKFGKASRQALLYGAIGLVIGLIAFPPLGGIIGLFLGVFIAELMRFNDTARALKTASFSLIGILIGAAVNFVLAITFFITFLVIVF